MRQVARIELPSTRAAMTFARRSVESRFILSIMPERSRIVKGDLDAVSDDALVEHAYLVSRGVRPMALAGYTSSGDWEMTRATTRLERLASPGAITFVIPRDDGLADCGYGACRWAIDLYGWALVSRRDAMPARYRHRIVGLLLGYSPMAIRDFEEANGG
jgi:hypothetical protein